MAEVILYSLGIMTGILLAVLQNWHTITCRSQARDARRMRRDVDQARRDLDSILHMMAHGSSVGQGDLADPAPDDEVLPPAPPLNSHVSRETLPWPPADDHEFFTAARLAEDGVRLETWAERVDAGDTQGRAAIAYALAMSPEPDTTAIPAERRVPGSVSSGGVNPGRRRSDHGQYPTFTARQEHTDV